MAHITLSPIDDFAALGQRWQALETQADGGFFRSWAFLGCQAKTRFAGARLLCARRDGADVALALIGRGGGTSWLNQTGNPVADSLFIEHNGLLVRRGHEDVVIPALRHAAPLVLSGIDTATLQQARLAGWCGPLHTRFAPCIDLGAVQKPFLETLSANARSQIRRSFRLYGPNLRLDRAESLAQAQSWFAEMVSLHQATWTQRGKPGAFAQPSIVAFHTALIARAWPQGNIDLLRITAGEKTIGILYNFVHEGRVSLYQSGFTYEAGAKHKPGLVCHSLAIEDYAARGLRVYDFLAGADRYKTTLSHAGQNLHWLTLHKPWSANGLRAKIFCFFFSKKKSLLF